TGAEVAMAPWSSVALAVRMYAPAGTLVHVSMNGFSGPTISGLFVVTPRLWVPSKNSTVATKPSTSSGRAERRILAGAIKVAPSLGKAILTSGGWLVAAGP